MHNVQGAVSAAGTYYLSRSRGEATHGQLIPATPNGGTLEAGTARRAGHRAGGSLVLAGPRRDLDRDRARGAPDALRRAAIGAGEGNRTPIFGLGSQRLSHWTTPAGVGSVTDADTLAACVCASSGRSPSPPRRSSGCSPTGSSPRARTRRSTRRWPSGAAAGGAARLAALAAHQAARARSPTTRARSSCSTCGPRGASRAARRCRCCRRRTRRSSPRAGSCSGVDTQDAIEQGARSSSKERKATFPSLRDRDRAYGREFGVTGYPETFLIDRQGRIAAMRRFPVTQEWLDQHLPKLLAEQA